MSHHRKSSSDAVHARGVTTIDVYVAFEVVGAESVEDAIRDVGEALKSLPQEIQDRFRPVVNETVTWEYANA